MICKLMMSVLAAASIAYASHAQRIQPPVETYGRLPSVIDAEISPDGTKVAFLKQIGDGREVQVYDLANRTYTHRFDASHLETRNIEFGDSDHVLLFASAAAGPKRSWNRRAELDAVIALSLKTERTIGLLSREDRILPYQLDLGDIVGRLDNGQLLIPAYVGNKGGAIRRNLLRADPDSGRGFTHGTGEFDTQEWYVDRSGSPLVREKYDFKTHDFALEVHQNGKWKSFYSERGAVEYPLLTEAVTENGDGLYFRDYLERAGSYGDLSVIRFDGSIERGLPGDIDHILTDKNRHALAFQYAGASPTYRFVDDTLGENYGTVRTNLPGATILISSWSEDRTRVLYRVFDGTQVDYLMLYDSETGKALRLASVREDIPAEAVGRVYTVNYPAADGTQLSATLTLPPGKPLEAGLKLPMIVQPFVSVLATDHQDFNWLGQFFASRGYVVMQPSMRGKSIFGGAYISEEDEDSRQVQLEDIEAGVRAMVADGIADPERICAVGLSDGGFTALMSVAAYPDLFACAASYGAVTNLATLLQDYQNRYLDDQINAGWQRLIGSTDRHVLEAASPMGNLDSIDAPLLLIHGDEDLTVPPSQSRRMTQALETADKAVELIILDKGDHWLSESETRLAALKAFSRFVDRHIGAGQPAP